MTVIIAFLANVLVAVAKTVAAILTSIQSLLHDPNPNSPANAEAAQLYRENMKEYVRRVRATVEESWLDPEEHEKMETETAAQAEGTTA